MVDGDSRRRPLAVRGGSRRRFLKVAGVTGLGALAGCTSSQEERETTAPTRETAATTATETTTAADTTGEQITTTEESDGITGRINAVPADSEAEWADAGIFDVLDGETTYEIDLEQARSRTVNEPYWEENYTGLLETANNVDQLETREEIIETHNQETSGGSYEPGSIVDWGVYASDRPFHERWEQSGMDRLWYAVERNTMGGYISSGHMNGKAAWIETVETEVLGNDILAFGHQSKRGNHGLVSLIENPTYNEGEFGQQETYWVETDPSQDQQAGELTEDDCPYLRDDEYPTETDWPLEAFFINMMDDNDVGDVYDQMNVGSTIKRDFGEFMTQNQSETSGQFLIDMMATAYELQTDSRAMDCTVRLTADSIAVS